MDPELEARIVAALRQASRDARSYDHQIEAAALVAILTQPLPEPAPPTPPLEPEITITPATEPGPQS